MQPTKLWRIMSTRFFAPIAAILLVAASSGLPAADEEAELEALRGRMTDMRRALESDQGKRSAAETELRKVETDIGERNAALRRLRDQQSETARRIGELERERVAVEARIGVERDSLAAQVRAAYVTGRNERLKLLLNQQDPAHLGRMVVYYDYFNRMRRDTIASVSADLARLNAVAAEQETEAMRQRQLEQRQSQELDKLEQARARRAEVLVAVDASIRAKGDAIAEMETQAATLEKLVEELREVLRDFPVEADAPFADVKGQLAWPLRGRLLRDFGQPRAQGRLKWDGVLVGAAPGTQVKAVYHGRVAYADWLTGLGLLVILEHGDGYLTLYGHNESVFKSVGEWVAPGETIAEVGDSGGQAQPALYFEIRRGRQPQNPHRWFADGLALR
ncbi:MAG: peptidoglycan DD-metalloendopeptidase family protein [Chromatiales bacterium]|nr:peptidoglycan DD-metalloendopeptidase family protein [Chromatiales bacterium]MDH4014779.1 peptidoglycan DD-metalloendopeptidase family protein [Chromatiales bacterium]